MTLKRLTIESNPFVVKLGILYQFTLHIRINMHSSMKMHIYMDVHKYVRCIHVQPISLQHALTTSEIVLTDTRLLVHKWK